MNISEMLKNIARRLGFSKIFENEKSDSRLSPKSSEPTLLESEPKTFGTLGPLDPEKNFALPSEDLLPEVDTLITLKKYFIIHGNKTGKTTFALSYLNKINFEKRFLALYLSLKPLEGSNNLQKAMATLNSILKESLPDSKVPALRNSAKFLPVFVPKDQTDSEVSKNPDIYNYPSNSRRSEKPESLNSSEAKEASLNPIPDHKKSETAPIEPVGDIEEEKYFHTPLKVTTALSGALKALCGNLDKDLVIFFDDIEAMSYDVLISFLRQLRAGYLMRRAGAPFPRSVILLSRTNIRDLRPSEGLEIDNTGATSPFNIFTKSLSMPYFKEEKIAELYAQCPVLTKLGFDEDAVKTVFGWTKGHPLLVNLIAKEILASLSIDGEGNAVGLGQNDGESGSAALASLYVNLAVKAILEKNPPLISFSV
jgi:hypothetical protein